MRKILIFLLAGVMSPCFLDEFPDSNIRIIPESNPKFIVYEVRKYSTDSKWDLVKTQYNTKGTRDYLQLWIQYPTGVLKTGDTLKLTK